MRPTRSAVVVSAKLSLICCGAFACGSSSGGSAPASSDISNASPDPGYSVQEGADLQPPSVADGFQLVTPDYNASDSNAAKMLVNPGSEIFLCYYITLPTTAEFDVGAFESWMSPDSSHHFILYQQTAGTLFSGTPEPSGTIQSCAFGGGNWVYATSTPGAVVRSTLPEGVGLPFPAAQQLILNMHFINTGTTPLYPKVKLNILAAKNVVYKAAALTSFNTSINVPAATATGPGKQTVSGNCTVTAGSKVFSMSTHTHKHATAAVVSFVSGGVAQEIVHTGDDAAYPVEQQPGTGTDWEHPGVSLWDAPNFLTVNAGDSFNYSCSYENDATTAVTVGETAASNEMCMAVGYYFPAGSVSCTDTTGSN
jgi:hypothetical protein